MLVIDFTSCGKRILLDLYHRFIRTKINRRVPPQRRQVQAVHRALSQSKTFFRTDVQCVRWSVHVKRLKDVCSNGKHTIFLGGIERRE
jgi:hypothetical protein